MLGLRCALARLTIRRTGSSVLILEIADIYDLAILNFISTSAIVWIHTPFLFREELPFLPRLIGRLSSTVSARNHLICTNSDLMAKEAKIILPKHRVQALCIPYEDINGSPRLLQRENLVLMVGRIDRDKNFHLGIDVLHSIVRQSSVPIHLLIVGEPRNAEYLRFLSNRIRQLDLEKRVSIIPEGDPETIRQLYSRARILWNFSAGYYGLANVEAMARGCIPLVTPNMRDVVPSQKLVCDSVDAFAERTIWLLQDPDPDQMRRIAICHAAHRFSPSRFQADVDRLVSMVRGREI
jgi:glycosyltransferase involved in cell wall biosynthesis